MKSRNGKEQRTRGVKKTAGAELLLPDMSSRGAYPCKAARGDSDGRRAPYFPVLCAETTQKKPAFRCGLYNTGFLILLAAFLCAAGISGCGGRHKNTSAPAPTAENSAAADTPADTSKAGEVPDPDTASGGHTESGRASTKSAEAVPAHAGIPAAAEHPLQIHYHVGDSLQDGSLRIVYMASGEYHETSRYRQPPEGQKIVFLQFSLENTSDTRGCSLPLFSFDCFADGTRAEPYYGSGEDLTVDLPADRSAVTQIRFTVPEKADQIDVEYTTQFLTSEKLHFFYEGEQSADYTVPVRSRRSAGALKAGAGMEADGLYLTYTSCRQDDSDSEFIRPAEGSSFVTLTLRIENLLEEEIDTGIYDFQCFADGQLCRTVLFRDDPLTGPVAPGQSTEGTVTFEIPDDAATVEAEYNCFERTSNPVILTVR